jgi:hypothetical protein
MNHIFGIQAECGSDGRLSHGDGTDLLPGRQQFRSCLFMDTGISAQSDNRPGIRRVHNGIYPHIGDIISDNLKGHHKHLFFSLSEYILLSSALNVKIAKVKTTALQQSSIKIAGCSHNVPSAFFAYPQKAENTGFLSKSGQTVEKPLFCVKQDRGSLHIEG